MEGHVATTNPWLVMAINMSIVFAVLISLWILISIIHFIDPTKKKQVVAEVPAAVPATAAVDSTPAAATNDDEVVAAIVAAIVSMGYSSDQIASIRPVVSRGWKLDGRLQGRMARL